MDKVKGDAIEGFTLLHKAVFHAKVDELQKLLEEKKDDTVTGKPFDVNAKCILKQTPLILCVRQHYDEDKQGKGDIMCKMLLDHGATVVEDGKLIRDAYGDATLHLAAMSCFKNGPGMLKMLVDKICEEVTNPADLTEIISESCENFKNTPLHWVALHGNIEAAKYLIEKGARLGKKNKLKEKVLDYAKKYEHPKLLVLVESEEERRAAKRNASS
ncbi:hypothetical protein AB1Y20_006282 [Prymnesium parvum]|uniref:Ankyrin repeat protein n=1 Tax=Prymnesium parvum TaxID=97485 RepID=A0AB34J4Q2_PRYPA